MTAALEVKSLVKTYLTDDVKVRAVDDVSLRVAPGEFVAIVGPSGSGKTTTLAMLAGLLRPDSGEISIGGQVLGELKDSQLTAFRRKHIGFTFQDNNLVADFSILENVELMMWLNGQLDRRGRRRAQDLLTRLGLGDRLASVPSQLSAGQQQRVAIARALAHDPTLVLADEPTANLDTERARQVMGTFAQLVHEERRAGIIVTHDLRMCAFVDRVLQMVDGRVVGSVDDRDEIEALAGAAVTAA